MEEIDTFQEFRVYKLSKKLAEKYAGEIVLALDLIPQVDKHHKEEVLTEKKGERVLHAKWDHSLIALTEGGEFAGIIIGYEREKEGNDQYPDNCIYLSDLAVDKSFQKKGLGKFLCESWIEYNKQIGFKELEGNLKLCVQTNQESWNEHVQKLYESFGFQKTGEKQYGNRIDNIYSLTCDPRGI